MSNETDCPLSKAKLEYFEKKLKEWAELLEEEPINMEMEAASEVIDIANRETMLDLEAAKCERNLQTLKEIKNALRKIKEGDFGICEETGEKISEKRLEANPIARYSIEAQEQFEKRRKN